MVVVSWLGAQRALSLHILVTGGQTKPLAHQQGGANRSNQPGCCCHLGQLALLATQKTSEAT